MPLLDNVDVCLLTQVNQLATRYAINPCDFVATIGHDKATGHSVLTFETPPGNLKDDARFNRMLESIGVDKDQKLVCSAKDMYVALDRALAKAPKLRTKG